MSLRFDVLKHIIVHENNSDTGAENFNENNENNSSSSVGNGNKMCDVNNKNAESIFRDNPRSDSVSEKRNGAVSNS